MRAARLLRMLLLLQNRGRLTSRALAAELEVSTRTILRDVDAMTEAGLPVIVLQGNQGGIELGFDYRTRLTGLSADEAEALGVLLARPVPELAAIGLGAAGKTAVAKLRELFPDTVRARMARGAEIFGLSGGGDPGNDVRVGAMADAVRQRSIVQLQSRSLRPKTIRPVHLSFDGLRWSVVDRDGQDTPIPLEEWGDIAISAKRFDA